MAVLSFALLHTKTATQDELLVAAGSMPYRAIEARLNGWPYKPYRNGFDKKDSPSTLRFRAAALHLLSTPVSSELLHRHAVAWLVLGEQQSAIRELAESAAQTNNVGAWSDLAAALLVDGEQSNDPGRAVDALAAADNALAVDAANASALFNRALVLGRLGLLAEARTAWTRYLRVDTASPWADEALQRIHEIGLSNSTQEWERGLAAVRRLPRDRRSTAMSVLASQYAEMARLWAESSAMTDWADALLKHATPVAVEKLELARVVSKTLRSHSGEMLLADAVATADHAVANGKAERLAHAYVVYRDGRLAHSKHRPADAERKLRRAEELFAASGGPMCHVARYYRASALNAQLKLKEAGTLLDGLASQHFDRRGYRAFNAMVGWERGSSLLQRGAISEAIDVFAHARDELLVLGERDRAAVMDSFLASASDYVGDAVASWRERRRALEALSRSGNRSRRLVVVESAAAAAVRAGEGNRARSLLRLTSAEADEQREPLVAAEAFTLLALADARQGRMTSASRELAAARQWIGRMPDVSSRARAEASVAFVDGMMSGRDNPRLALAHFSHALRFYETAGRRVEIPRIHLERARLEQRLGALQDARDDLLRGITVIEHERRQVHDFEQRATLMVAADEIYETAVDMAMRAGDAEGAFNVSERHRARALADRFQLGDDLPIAEAKPLPLSKIQASMAPDAAIVEYASLPDRLLAFVVRHSSFSVVPVDVTRDRLSALMQSFREAARTGSVNALAAASAAHAVLLQPLRKALDGATIVAFVPDRYLSMIPCAALYDAATGRFAIDDVAVTIAPSATLAVNASVRIAPAARSSIAAVGGSVIDDSEYPNLPALRQAEHEARSIAALYPRSAVFVGERATPEAVAGVLEHCDVAHFATHGITVKPSDESALLLAPASSNHGELRVRDLARLSMRNTSVVVLAACGSGATLARGDGAENLGLAFMAAGVPVVIATMSDIDDEASSPVMVALHRRLSRGADAAQAVRELTVSQIRDARGSIRFPLQWSSITVLGGSVGLVEKKKGERRL